MNTENKKRIPGITIVSFSFAVVLILGLTFMERPEYTYKVSETEMLNRIVEQNGVVKPAELEAIIEAKDESVKIIDLRSAHDYNVSHISGAIHIPVHKLLDKEYKAIFTDKETKKIVYHNSQAEACGPWMVLNMTGYENVKILLGGYNYTKLSGADSLKNNSDSVGYRDEYPKYDFALIGKASGAPVAQANETNQTAPVKIAPKKKKSGVGGGC